MYVYIVSLPRPLFSFSILMSNEKSDLGSDTSVCMYVRAYVVANQIAAMFQGIISTYIIYHVHWSRVARSLHIRTKKKGLVNFCKTKLLCEVH